MSGKECYHFTYLNRAFSIRDIGLVPRIEDNSRSVKDASEKVSFSDGRYAAAFLMANFYKVYMDVKEGRRDESQTDSIMAKKIRESKSFEDLLGDGMYLVFDGTDVENTGGNRGHINPFDAGTRENIAPKDLKVCLLRNDETGEITYSKYDFAQYLIANLTQEDYVKMPDDCEKINFYKEHYSEEIDRFKKVPYSIIHMSLDEFCETYKKEIEADIEKREQSLSENDKKKEDDEKGSSNNKSITMKSVISNAIRRGTSIEEVAEYDHAEQEVIQSQELEGDSKDAK